MLLTACFQSYSSLFDSNEGVLLQGKVLLQVLSSDVTYAGSNAQLHMASYAGSNTQQRLYKVSLGSEEHEGKTQVEQLRQQLNLQTFFLFYSKQGHVRKVKVCLKSKTQPHRMQGVN
jgi:hypothetical protein